MKVALIGNTCNNNFAFLRYLIDLGIDAHLFLYSNEGKNDSNPIHSPSWDTFSINKIENNISYLDIPNGLISVVGRPDKLKPPLNLTSFSNSISNFDICVGSGLTPAIFKRLKKRLDVFYPYSIGIEWIGECETRKKLSTFNLELPFRKLLKSYQLEGIRNARKVINWIPGYTEDILKEHSIPFKMMHIPVYYPERINIEPKKALEKLDNSLIKKITDNNVFNIFSFMRHFWVFNTKNYDSQSWSNNNKNNNLLILGFKKFISKFPDSNVLLFLSEWGPDVDESKKLISKLEIKEKVEWLPLLPRSYISYILSKYANLAVGEFAISPNEIWGSTAWECIALGAPFMQTINFSDSYFQKKFGYPLPPKVLDVKSSDDVYIHIENQYIKNSSSKLKEEENISWFNSYNSHALAAKWINLFEEIINKKS